MQIDRDWLLRKIKEDPDDLACEAGILHPEAPLPKAIGALSPVSTVEDLTNVVVMIHKSGYEPSYKDLFYEAARVAVGMSDEDFARFTEVLRA
jgi:hypothetical protein